MEAHIEGAPVDKYSATAFEADKHVTRCYTEAMVPRLGPLKLKAQIFCGDEAAIGPGKADLLEAIDREGSISAAGRALGMSYRRTWLLVDSMNRCWLDKLVDTKPGGGSDKGARITDFGKQVLATYRALERSLLDTAETGGLDALMPLLRNAPLPPN